MVSAVADQQAGFSEYRSLTNQVPRRPWMEFAIMLSAAYPISLPLHLRCRWM